MKKHVAKPGLLIAAEFTRAIVIHSTVSVDPNNRSSRLPAQTAIQINIIEKDGHCMI